MRLNARSLEQIDEPRFPDGYRVRTVEERDWSSRVDGPPLGLPPVALPGRPLCVRAVDSCVSRRPRLRGRGARRLDRRLHARLARRGERRRPVRAGRHARRPSPPRASAGRSACSHCNGSATWARPPRSSSAVAMPRIRSPPSSTSRSASGRSRARWRTAASPAVCNRANRAGSTHERGDLRPRGRDRRGAADRLRRVLGGGPPKSQGGADRRAAAPRRHCNSPGLIRALPRGRHVGHPAPPDRSRSRRGTSGRPCSPRTSPGAPSGRRCSPCSWTCSSSTRSQLRTAKPTRLSQSASDAMSLALARTDEALPVLAPYARGDHLYWSRFQARLARLLKR